MRHLLAALWMLWISTLTAGCATAGAGPRDFWLRDGDRILMLGDSITHGGAYATYLEAYLYTRYPGKRFDVIAIGLSSETVSGLSEKDHPFPRPDAHERLGRALARIKPNVVTACYGMNDGIYHPPSEQRLDAYRRGIDRLVERCRAAGVERIVLITPPPFDAHAPGMKDKVVGADAPDFGYKTPYRGYDDVLRRYGRDLIDRYAGRPDVRTVDIHTPMSKFLTERRKKHPAYHLAGDGIHPNRFGHGLMAIGLIEGLGGSTSLGRHTFERGTVQAEAPRLLLGDITMKLPMPLDPAWDPTLVNAIRFHDRLNGYRLTARAAGRLFANNQPLDTFTAQALRDGINPYRQTSFAPNARAAELLERMDQRRRLRSDAWRQHVGHRRPGNYPAKPIDEAEKEAAELDRQIRAQVRPMRVRFTVQPLP